MPIMHRLALLLATAFMTLLPAHAEKYPGLMPLSEVRTGMKGYGLTVFKGTTISRFEVTVLGIVRKVNNGRDLILIRMKGGPITERQANLIQGMSGSPIYINGRLIGGFSQGEGFSKEPVGMVTPIEDMLEVWNPQIPQQPNYFTPQELNPALNKRTSWSPNNQTHTVALPEPIKIGGRQIRHLVLNARLEDPRRPTTDTAVLHRATTLLCVSGMKPRERDWLQKELDQKGYGITVLAGASIGRSSVPLKTDLRPGSAFGAFFATGDILVGSTGTITYRYGNRVVGFGHPFFGMGAMEAELTSASIVDIFSGYQVSHHIATVGETIGTLTQDRDFSVGGVVGRKPRTVPFEVMVKDRTNGITKTFHVNLFLHPDLTPTLMRTVARQAISQVHNMPGDVMAKVQTTVTADEIGTLTRSNLLYDPSDISISATQDLSEINAIAAGNPFYPLPIRSGKLSIEIYAGRNIANLERIFLKQGKFEPGETLEVGVQLKPPRRPVFYRTLRLPIPQNTPSGKYQLIVRGGAPMITRMGGFTFMSGSGESATPPANIAQMVAHLKEQNTNTDIIGRLLLNTTVPAVEGERLRQLPPHLSAFMRSERNSAVRLEREEVRASISTDIVVTGMQQILINVVRKNTQDQNSGGRSGAGSPSGTDPSSSPAGGGNIRFGNPSLLEEDSRYPQGETLFLDQKQSTKTKTPASLKQEQPPASAQESVKPPAAAVAPATQATPPAKPALPEKPIGKQALIWKQTGRDFVTGKFTGAGVTGNGELRSTLTLTPLASSNETYLWSLVANDSGTLFAGTGNSASILKSTPTGVLQTLTKLPAIAVHSLILEKQGDLIAGTGAPGLVYRVSQNGTSTLLGKVAEKYVTTLAEDSQSRLYVGTGSSGTLYRLLPQGRLEAWVRTGSDYITALALDAKDNLYVAGGGEGVLYRITPEGKSTVLYSTKEGALTCLAVDSKGTIYAGTGPKGNLISISPNGTATTLYDKATSFYMALRLANDKTLYAMTANALYQVTPQGLPDGSPFILPLELSREVDLASLALLPEGRVATGTVNMGEILVAKPSSIKTYESVIHDARADAHWGRVRWVSGTKPALETRSGNVAEPDGTWSAWESVKGAEGNEATLASPSARFLQYRVALDDNTKIKEVSFSFVAKNQAPRVSFQVPVGGERWSGLQNLRWNAQDPDGDTLTYDLLYSADNGATWKPLPTGKTETKNTEAKPSQGATQPNTSLEDLKKRLDATNMPASMKELLLERAKQRAGQQGGSTPASPPSKEASRALDTSLLPDGAYLLKVIASDQGVNPADGKTALSFSETFLVCNALPTHTQLKVTITPETGAVLEGKVAQKGVAIVAVQYRVDEGEWVPVVPNDGLFDSSTESYSALLPKLAQGTHVVEVLAFNAAGGKATSKATIEIR